MRELGAGELAIEVRDLLLVRLAGDRLELVRDANRLLPVLFLLIDLEEEIERGLRVRRAFEPQEKLLGAIQQAGLEIVLRELEERDELLVFLEIGALDEVLVHAYRTLHFAAAAKETPEREMQLDRLRIHFDHFNERLDRLVGLLVQQ